MTDDRVEAIAELLAATEAAHGAYETTELNGVYDQAWANWYAAYAVDHGMGAVLGREIGAEELALLLATTYEEFHAIDPPPAEGWQTFIARRIVGIAA